MPVVISWIDEPHILLLEYSGPLQLQEIAGAWEEMHSLFMQRQIKPFCNLSLVHADTKIPTGILKLATHPVVKHASNTQAVALVGLDHFLINLLVDMISRVPFGPNFHRFKTYDEALAFLRQEVVSSTPR